MKHFPTTSRPVHFDDLDGLTVNRAPRTTSAGLAFAAGVAFGAACAVFVILNFFCPLS